MNDITYKITFHSEWHCGSGLTSGSDLDALVVKDKDGFPFIPGKTLKGLLKEAAEEILKFQDKEPMNEPFITELFGFFDEKNNKESRIHKKGKAFFADANLSSELRSKVTKELTEFFYREVASTKIGDNGIAEAHSLRKMQTTIPCELSATIYGVDDQYTQQLAQCMQYIKRLGQNRNRGLGRCKFEIMETKEANQ
jgi:CRISPR/Cas system CSM-associated protein Csm3 (group 7 of RAMP superfamily)